MDSILVGLMTRTTMIGEPSQRRAFGAAAVVADAEAWKSLKELPS